MLEFLISLFILVLSSQSAISQEVRQKIAQNLSERLENVQNTPSINPNPLNMITKILSPTPESEFETKVITNMDSQQEGQESSRGNFNNIHDDNKSDAYNSKSEKPIGEVANKAIQNSTVIIPCTENPEFCYPTATVKPSPTVTSTNEILPSATPTPKIDPIPTICPDKLIECPLIMCIEVREDLRYPEYDTCGCRCNPIIL